MTATTEIAELGSFARLLLPPLRGNQAGETTLHWLTADLNLAQPFDSFRADVERRIRSQVHRRLGFARKLGSFRKKHGDHFAIGSEIDPHYLLLSRPPSMDLGSFGRIPSTNRDLGSFGRIPTRVRIWVRSAEIHRRSRQGVRSAEIRRMFRNWVRSAEFDGAFQKWISADSRSRLSSLCPPAERRSTHLAVCIAMDERAFNARTSLNAIVTSTTLISSIWLGLGVLIVSGWHGRYHSESRRYPNYRHVILSIARTKWAT